MELVATNKTIQDNYFTDLLMLTFFLNAKFEPGCASLIHGIKMLDPDYGKQLIILQLHYQLLSGGVINLLLLRGEFNTGQLCLSYHSMEHLIIKGSKASCQNVAMQCGLRGNYEGQLKCNFLKEKAVNKKIRAQTMVVSES